MKVFKVIYESLNGATKVVRVSAPSEKDVVEYVFNRYPDCFQVISPDPRYL